MQVWWDDDADGVRDDDERDRMGGGAVFADYNSDGVRQERETQVGTAADGSYSLPVDTRRLAPGRTSVEVRFAFAYGTRASEFDPTCLPPVAGCVRTVQVAAGQTTPGADFPNAGVSQLNGTIWDDKNENGRQEAGEEGVVGLRVFLDDNDNGRIDAGELVTRRTVRGGYFNIPLPTRYQVAGGNLPPLIVERLPGMDCTAPATDCRITGLKSETGELLTVNPGVARPVVIFSHGYGGSRLVCPGKLMWFTPYPGPALMDMRLGADGENLKADDGGTPCSENASVDGLLMDVAGEDIYGESSEHFKAITWPGRHYDFVWDWRKDPTTAVGDLDKLVERARAEHGVSRVVLVGHSQGGLVMRHYIDDPAKAEKVSRAVTVGTPYWGAPKTILPLAAGIEVPWYSPMDIFMSTLGLKSASRSFPGHFSLVPAFGYGPWLSVSGLNGGRPLDMDGVRTYLKAIGVNPDMYTRGAEHHGRVLDHFEDNGVDFHVIVGGGVPTIGSVGIEYGVLDRLNVNWVSGDETVPMFSAAHDTPRDRLHVVCGLKHIPITADDQTTRLMDDFLIRGEKIRDERDDCPWNGQELTVYYPDQLTQMAKAAQASKAQPKVVVDGRAMSLRDAEGAGHVQVITFGGSVKIVAQGGSDVRVDLPAGGTAAVRALSERGASAEQRFAITGASSVALGGSGAVTRGGKALKPVTKDKQPPVTKATVRGRKLVLKARDASRVAATFVTVGGKQRVYTKPLRLTAKQLKKATYGSIDIWGNAEKARPIRSR